MTAISTLRQIHQRKPFKDWHHAYWLGADRLYSLSRMLRDLELKPDFSGVDKRIMFEAATCGKLTENYCYALLRGDRVTVRAKHTGSLYDRVKARVECFYRWKEAVQPEFVDCRTIVFSKDDRVAWERDFRAVIGGKLHLVDIKCTAATAKDWPLQIGCGLSYDEDGAEHGAVLHLNPKMSKAGYKWRPYHGPTVKSQYRRAVDHWKTTRDFNRLKGEMGFDSVADGLEPEEIEAEL